MEGNAESAVMLPCRHIMGFECLSRWFEGHNSCPMCRTTLFGICRPTIFDEDVSLAELAWRLSADVLSRSEISALSALMAQNDLDMQVNSALSAETARHLARLAELSATSGTEETRTEVFRVVRRNSEIMAQLEEIEERLRRRRAQGSGAAR